MAVRGIYVVMQACLRQSYLICSFFSVFCSVGGIGKDLWGWGLATTLFSHSSPVFEQLGKEQKTVFFRRLPFSVALRTVEDKPGSLLKLPFAGLWFYFLPLF